MRDLQEMLEQELRELVSSYDEIMPHMIAWKIKKSTGIVLSDNSLKLIEAQVRSKEKNNKDQNSKDSFDLDLPELKRRVTITGADLKQARKLIRTRMPTVYEGLLKTAKDFLIENIDKEMPHLLKTTKADYKQFEEDLLDIWKEPLQQLDGFILLNRNIGDIFSNAFLENFPNKSNYLYSVITRLQAISCRIALEILTLLKSGFADGAYARWRSMHETITIALFICDNGQKAARMYSDYATVSRRKAAMMLNTHAEALNMEQYSDRELNDIESSYKKVLKKYGEHFGKDYGWAISFLPEFKSKIDEHLINGKKKKDIRINFSHIEESVGLKHYRPFYKMASENIHASASAMYNPLGLLGVEDDLVMSGPSQMGLAIPIGSTSLSLLMVTEAMLQLESTFDSHLYQEVLTDYHDRIDKACSLVNC